MVPALLFILIPFCSKLVPSVEAKHIFSTRQFTRSDSAIFVKLKFKNSLMCNCPASSLGEGDAKSVRFPVPPYRPLGRRYLTYPSKIHRSPITDHRSPGLVRHRLSEDDAKSRYDSPSLRIVPSGDDTWLPSQ